MVKAGSKVAATGVDARITETSLCATHCAD